MGEYNGEKRSAVLGVFLGGVVLPLDVACAAVDDEAGFEEGRSRGGCLLILHG